jgi:monomeric isocitrate dehydrogenase
MPAMIRTSGHMWSKDDTEEDTLAVLPDSSDLDGARGGDLEGLVVRAVLLGLLRHEAHVRDGAHGASMPAMIRTSGHMWSKDDTEEDTLAVLPDSSYAGV